MEVTAMDVLRASEWYRTRPPEIRRLIEKYPPNTVFLIEGKTYHLIGYAEGEGGKAAGLKLSEYNPIDSDDGYERARRDNFFVCLECIERGGAACGHGDRQ